MNSSVSALIPVHNRADLLARLLATMRAQTVPFAEIIVIDNGSSDGARDIARDAGCRVVEWTENAGFAKAVNQGAREAGSSWIAILNSDVELDARWLERLLAAAVDASFATGTILNAADHSRIDGTYDLISRAACAWRAGHGEARGPTDGAPSRIGIAPATACLFRRADFENLGGFDEGFGSYLEDVDLGLRGIQAGLSGVFAPDAIAYHHGSATLGRWNPKVVRLISRNQLRLVSRHYDRAMFRSCLWPIVAGQLLWGVVALRHGTGFAWMSGKLDALNGFRLEGRPSQTLRDFLDASEHEIRTRARDPYWRWYSRLTVAADVTH